MDCHTRRQLEAQRAFDRFCTDEVETVEFSTVTRGGAIQTQLRRLVPWEEPRKAVLILHGGNSSSDTFLLPGGGLAAYLRSKGWDVWLLDWRGSPYVVRPLLGGQRLGGSVAEECRIMTLDGAAAEELPRALERVRAAIGDGAHLSLMGHCLAGGVVSMAVARGHLPAIARVNDIVFTTMALFYEVPWDGGLKSEDFILERVLAEAPECRGIDPHDSASWPGPFARAYAHWPKSWLVENTCPTDALLHRLSFMVGKPWSPARLSPGLHGPVLHRVFASMHLGIYVQTGQLVRRGYSARLDEPDVIDRSRLAAFDGRVRPEDAGDLVFEPFREKFVTLIAAAENRVWHRDAMDLMYEWLRSNGGAAGRARYTKHVLRDYNLQELFWGENAATDVYPLIERGLRASAPAV